MNSKNSFLDMLRCPLHPNGGALLQVEGERRHAQDAAVGLGLRCPVCARVYSIVDGIADMVVERGPQEAFLKAESRQWDEQATSYEVKRMQDRVYMAGVDAAIDALMPQPGEIILDAGCGTGLTVRHYFRLGIQVVALDLSMQSLRFLQWALDGAPVGLVRGDLSTLPFEDSAFDKVLCANAIQHVPDEGRRRQCVRELARVARPGARVVVTAHNLSIPKKRARWPKEGAAGSHSGRVQYIYRYEHSEFHSLLASALAVERIIGGGLPLPYRFKLSPLSRLLERFLRRFRVSAAWGNMLVGIGLKPADGSAGRDTLRR